MARVEVLSCLSLQERCLLYLITHVEDYSPQTLALLPRHLRRALLSSVAPLHLYQLDQTAVASGIDTEALWKDGSREDVSNVVSPILDDVINSREDFGRGLFRNATSVFQSGCSLLDSFCHLVKIEATLFGLFERRLSPDIAQHLKHNKAYTHFEEDNISVFVSAVSCNEALVLHDCCGRPSTQSDRQFHATIQEKFFTL